MKNIILALEFNERSHELVCKATSYAKQMNAELYLVHIILPVNTQVKLAVSNLQELPGLNPIGCNFYTNIKDILEKRIELASELREEHQKLLDFADFASSFGVKTHIALIEGDPTNEIINFAEKKESSMVMISLNEHSFFHKILFGSTAEELIKQTTVPLLLIPNREMESDDDDK